MAKVRVHELAKELGMPSKDLLSYLKEQGEFVKTASSTIEAPVVRKIKENPPAGAHADDGATEQKAPVKKAAPKPPTAEKSSSTTTTPAPRGTRQQGRTAAWPEARSEGGPPADCGSTGTSGTGTGCTQAGSREARARCSGDGSTGRFGDARGAAVPQRRPASGGSRSAPRAPAGDATFGWQPWRCTASGRSAPR